MIAHSSYNINFNASLTFSKSCCPVDARYNAEHGLRLAYRSLIRILHQRYLERPIYNLALLGRFATASFATIPPCGSVARPISLLRVPTHTYWRVDTGTQHRLHICYNTRCLLTGFFKEPELLLTTWDAAKILEVIYCPFTAAGLRLNLTIRTAVITGTHMTPMKR